MAAVVINVKNAYNLVVLTINGETGSNTRSADLRLWRGEGLLGEEVKDIVVDKGNIGDISAWKQKPAIARSTDVSAGSAKETERRIHNNTTFLVIYHVKEHIFGRAIAK